jgi:hypothetical protein
MAAGRQIDKSDEQRANAQSSIDDNLEPGSKITLVICLHWQKQPLLNVSIWLSILTSDSFPKYLIIEIPSAFISICPLILKCKFPFGIEIYPRFGDAIADLPIT